jgi:hypothetical protein
LKVRRRKPPKRHRLLHQSHRNLLKSRDPVDLPSHRQQKARSEVNGQLVMIRFPMQAEAETANHPARNKLLPNRVMSLNRDVPVAAPIVLRQVARRNGMTDGETAGNGTTGNETTDNGITDNGLNSESALVPAACSYFEAIQALVLVILTLPATTTTMAGIEAAIRDMAIRRRGIRDAAGALRSTLARK